MSAVPTTIDSPLQALVFFEEGVGKASSLAICAQLTRVLHESIHVKMVDSKYLLSEAWESRTVVLAMGGGVCTVWESLLGVEGMKKIRNYVLNGNFIGFCAGAYFAAKESSFQLTGKLPLNHQRVLSFFNGKAIGPIFETEVPFTPKSAKALEVNFSWGDQSECGHLYYQDGCYFELEDPVDSTIEVVGHHGDLPIAVVCKVDNGTAFLCGVHPEFACPEKMSGHSIPKEMVRDLQLSEVFRSSIWNSIVKKLQLPTK